MGYWAAPSKWKLETLSKVSSTVVLCNEISRKWTSGLLPGTLDGM